MTDNRKTTVPGASVGADAVQSSDKITTNIITNSGKQINLQAAKKSNNFGLNTVSMTELYDTVYPPRKPIVNDLLYSGTYLFVGAPKVGKSFFMGQLAYHVAMGLPLWEYEVHQGTVLYLALEDDYARLQRRLSRMFGVEETSNLYFATQAKSVSEGLDQQLEGFIREHPDVRLIIIDGDEKRFSSTVNHLLRSLQTLKQTTVYLFLFSVFDDFDAGVIDDETLCKVLRLLLNYSIRRLICEVGSNSLRGLYKTLYGRVFNRPENKNNYYDSIVSFLLQLTSKDVMPSDAEFVAALKERNLYRKNALCKYLLVAIENQGKEQIKTDALTIEHIMPQNKNLSTAWQRMLGTDWELVRERYLHTLGNLTLTGYNSELGDLPFAEKLDKLAEENTHVTVLYSDVKNKTEWNAQTMESRAERLSEEVLKLFPIELPTTKVDFSDPRYRLYTVSDPHNATYKFVNYYELLGERVSADSFAFMVRSVAGKLYDLNSSIIDRMARNLEVFPAWQNPVFAYDKDAIRNAVKLKNDSAIYISTGYSAYDCICFIKALLKKYDLDLEEDFVYSARPNSTALAGINWKNIAQEWCEERDKRGEIVFDIKNCEGRYVRFTTPFLNSVIPTNEDILSPWKTNNYYFYEITSDKNELYVQLYFYCKGITDEMRTAFQKLANLTDGGKLTQGYRLFFKSSVFTQAENSTKSEIKNHLYRCLEEVRAFEMTIQDKWDS